MTKLDERIAFESGAASRQAEVDALRAEVDRAGDAGNEHGIALMQAEVDALRAKLDEAAVLVEYVQSAVGSAACPNGCSHRWCIQCRANEARRDKWLADHYAKKGG